MVINDKITSPQIANAYLITPLKNGKYRQHRKRGASAPRINLETGEIFEPEKIKNHIITPCPVHPDTGVIIRGVIPNWREIKEGVKDVSRYICQLEYMGFDVVATEDSFKILEINTHQDLHRYHHYGARSTDILWKKLTSVCQREEEKTMIFRNKKAEPRRGFSKISKRNHPDIRKGTQYRFGNRI